jgi:hypothetical protein
MKFIKSASSASIWLIDGGYLVMRAFSEHVAFAAIALKNEEDTLDTSMTSAKYLSSGILFPLSRHRVQPLFPYGLYQAFFS